MRGEWGSGTRRRGPESPSRTVPYHSPPPTPLCLAARRFRRAPHHRIQEMTISLAVPDILVARARAGDLEALEALYRAFETPAHNLALRMLRTPEDAEDVLQETFLEVVRSIKQYRGEGHLWGWIKRIAASKALMRIRRNQVRVTEEFDEEAVGVHAGHADAA